MTRNFFFLASRGLLILPLVLPLTGHADGRPGRTVLRARFDWGSRGVEGPAYVFDRPAKREGFYEFSAVAADTP